MYQKFTDEDLVTFLMNGDKYAFEAIYNRYWLKLYAVAYEETGTREEAEEIVHDVFESVWKRKEAVVIQNLSAYLVVSVKHRVNNYIKSRITQRRYQEHIIMNEVRQSFATEEFVRFSDLSQAVDEVMKKMPVKTSEVFKLSRFENLSVKDIASKLHLSEKGVEYHITQSLKLLREELKVYQSNN